MTRLYDWQLRLEAFVRERQAMPFMWGANDCGTFAMDAVQAMTGERLLPHIRGYNTARDALVLLEGTGGLRSIACHALGGFILPAYAAVGDVVLLRMGKREALGICNGGTVIGPGPTGIVAVSMEDALAAWRIG